MNRIHSSRRSSWLRPCVLSLALATSASVLGTPDLPPGVSGAWYNPAQPGHGLSVEVFDDERALAYWYVFDRDGRPVHLYIDGRIEGRSLLGEAYLGRGMRFGEFNPADHDLQRWGKVDLSFDDCGKATLDFDPDGPAGSAGFEAGSLPLRQLAPIAALSCDLDLVSEAPFGRLNGEILVHDLSPFGNSASLLEVAVDETGEVWGISDHPFPMTVSQVTPFYGTVINGRVTGVAPGSARLELDGLPNAGDDLGPAFEDDWQDWPYPNGPLSFSMMLAGTSTAGFAGFDSELDGVRAELRVNTPVEGSGIPNIEAVDSLAGSYTHQLLRTRVALGYVAEPSAAQIESDGTVCITSPFTAPACWLSGEISPVATDSGVSLMFDVVLRSEQEPRVFRGRGWKIEGEDPRVVLVTRDGDVGLGIVLRAD